MFLHLRHAATLAQRAQSAPNSSPALAHQTFPACSEAQTSTTPIVQMTKLRRRGTKSVVQGQHSQQVVPDCLAGHRSISEWRGPSLCPLTTLILLSPQARPPRCR